MLGGLAAATAALLLGLFAVSSAGSDWLLLMPCAILGTFAVTAAGFWLLLGLGRRLSAWN